MWNSLRPRIEPISPALVGDFTYCAMEDIPIYFDMCLVPITFPVMYDGMNTQFGGEKLVDNQLWENKTIHKYTRIFYILQQAGF